MMATLALRSPTTQSIGLMQRHLQRGNMLGQPPLSSNHLPSWKSLSFCLDNLQPSNGLVFHINSLYENILSKILPAQMLKSLQMLLTWCQAVLRCENFLFLDSGANKMQRLCWGKGSCVCHEQLNLKPWEILDRLRTLFKHIFNHSLHDEVWRLNYGQTWPVHPGQVAEAENTIPHSCAITQPQWLFGATFRGTTAWKKGMQNAKKCQI